MSAKFRVEAADWDMAVSDIRVVCHTLGPVANTAMSENHWSLYLIMGPNRSVRFNMRAEYGDPQGMMDVTSHNYAVTESEIRHWDYPAIRHLTVRMTYTTIITARFHCYLMSGGGSGCRWWV